eukprot:Polyplicarium_translucidae@DN2284_c0_g1_i3.p1
MTTTSRGTRRSVKGLVELPTDLIGSIIEYLDSGAVWRGLFCLSKSILALREQLFEGRRYEAREFKLIRFDPNPRSTQTARWQIERSIALRLYSVIDVGIPGTERRRVVVRTKPLPVVEPSSEEIMPEVAELVEVLCNSAPPVLPEIRTLNLVLPGGLADPTRCPAVPAAVLRQVTCPKLTTLICHWFSGMSEFVTRHRHTLRVVAVAGSSSLPPRSAWPTRRGKAALRDVPPSLVEAALPWRRLECQILEMGCRLQPPEYRTALNGPQITDGITAVAFGEVLENSIQIVSFPQTATLDGVRHGLKGVEYLTRSICFALTVVGEIGKALPFLKADGCSGCFRPVKQLAAGLSLTYRIHVEHPMKCTVFKEALLANGFRSLRQATFHTQWINTCRPPPPREQDREEEALIPAVMDCASYSHAAGLEFYPQETWVRVWDRADPECPHVKWLSQVIDRPSVSWWHVSNCNCALSWNVRITSMEFDQDAGPEPTK